MSLPSAGEEKGKKCELVKSSFSLFKARSERGCVASLLAAAGRAAAGVVRRGPESGGGGAPTRHHLSCRRPTQNERVSRFVSVLLVVVEAKSSVRYANQAKGAGTENPANYSQSKLVFLGIENIHAVRVAHKALFDHVLGQCLSGESSTGWYAGVEKTGWMEHVLSVVRGACKVE